MKKSVEIIGLPIINISQGQEIGKVKSLVINPEKGSIDFITIEHEDWQVSVKAIPYRKVVGVGEYAVTIDGENAVIDLNEIPIANELVNKKIRIIDTKVMTRKGELLGKVVEFFVDKENGEIVAMSVHINEKEVILSNEYVVTYGKDIIIVTEEAVLGLLGNIEELNQKNDANTMNEGIISDDERASLLYTESEEETALKEKQLELLVGKKVTTDIFKKNGQLFVSNGTILTENHIRTAQETGIDLIIQLSMNVEV